MARAGVETVDDLRLVRERPVGYALVVRDDGVDEAFLLALRYAQVYTLSMAGQARGGGFAVVCRRRPVGG